KSVPCFLRRYFGFGRETGQAFCIITKLPSSSARRIVCILASVTRIRTLTPSPLLACSLTAKSPVARLRPHSGRSAPLVSLLHLVYFQIEGIFASQALPLLK